MTFLPLSLSLNVNYCVFLSTSIIHLVHSATPNERLPIGNCILEERIEKITNSYSKEVTLIVRIPGG